MTVEIGRTGKNEPILVEPGPFSFKDFTNQRHIFEDRSKELPGVIYSSVFYQEDLDVDVFPSDVRDLILCYCNCDNIRLPTDTIYINTQEDMTPWLGIIRDRQSGKLMDQPLMFISDRMPIRIAVQNDLRPWEVDSRDQPVKVINEKYELMQGRSVDPADIPSTRLDTTEELPSKFDFINAFKAFEPEPSLDEEAILESLMARTSIAVEAKELAQAVDDEINRLSAIKLKIEASK